MTLVLDLKFFSSFKEIEMSHDMIVSIPWFFDVYHGTERLPHICIYMGFQTTVNAEKSKTSVALDVWSE